MVLNLTQLAINLISHLGYGGLALGLVIDSFGPPIPSEVLVPLGTVLALHGRFAVWAIFVVATLAQVVGGTIGYLIGRYGGEPLLERYGKYVLISHHELRRTHRAFERYGIWLTMVGRCVPGVRGVIAYPAGIAEMRFRTFLIFTTLGAALWTGFLMYMGFLIGNNLALIDQLASRFSLIGVVLLVGLLAWYFRHLWWRWGRDSASE
ncbi:MAG TPA: DedA family protein [Candidatus Saccharimonadia bacterium]|nr:DedA family protein [Candidatus Saccharimonadia bacterium]